MLTRAWIPLRYHELQSKLWRTQCRFPAIACGRGSGKTELARRRVVRYLPVQKPWALPRYFYGMPTYRQGRRVAWDSLNALVPDSWAKKRHSSDMRIETVFGTELYVVGLDKPARIEGDQWDGGVLDESCDLPPGVFERSVLPACTHRQAWVWRTGVPKRQGCGAAEFKAFCKIAAESYAWPSSDILTPAQLAEAKALMSEKDFNEQFNANWESATGGIFYAFSTANIVSCTYDPHLPIIVGSDFNVDPMAWTLSQHYTTDDSLRFFDEIFMRNTNTRETLDELHRRYGSHRAGFFFFGDATSRARNTRASESDYVQIKNDQRFYNKMVMYPRHNPARSDRFAACNAALCSADYVRRVEIDPRCKHLIKDLEDRAYAPGSTEPDDSGDIGHITDAFGYTIMRVFPLLVRSTEAQSGVYTSG